MSPPNRDKPNRDAHDGDRQGCDQLGQAVDAAVGAGYDRAFDLLEDFAADAGNACPCRRCRTRSMNLGLILRRELRLDQRLSGRWITPP